MNKGEEFGKELSFLDDYPDRCEHCGPVKKAYPHGGTAWCKECLKLVKLEEKK